MKWLKLVERFVVIDPKVGDQGLNQENDEALLQTIVQVSWRNAFGHVGCNSKAVDVGHQFYGLTVHEIYLDEDTLIFKEIKLFFSLSLTDPLLDDIVNFLEF